MNNQLKNNLGFEVLESDENSVVYKRVLPDKGRKRKDVLTRELELPKATMHLFDERDIQKLKQIEQELIQQMSLGKHRKNWYEIIAKVLGVDFSE